MDDAGQDRTRPPTLRVVQGGGATTPPVRAPLELVLDEPHPYLELFALMPGTGDDDGT